MIRHKDTGVMFDNMKEAIIIMGQTRFKRFLKNGEFEFFTEEEWLKENHIK